MTEWKVGQRVRATREIKCEQLVDGVMQKDHLTASPGDTGEVEYVNDDGVPTVRFTPSGYSTIVDDSEIDLRRPFIDG